MEKTAQTCDEGIPVLVGLARDGNDAQEVSALAALVFLSLNTAPRFQLLKPAGSRCCWRWRGKVTMFRKRVWWNYLHEWSFCCHDESWDAFDETETTNMADTLGLYTDNTFIA